MDIEIEINIKKSNEHKNKIKYDKKYRQTYQE